MATIYIFIGPPGAGKGTLGDVFCEKTGVIHVSTGQMLRDEIAAQSELGLKVKGIIASGALVSDEVVAEIVESRLSKADIAAHGCLLDGFPRTLPQAEMLTKILAKGGHVMAPVVLIDADREVILQRLTSRRMCSNKACGAIYNIISLKPKKEGICDKCGAPLEQRKDDTMETALNRLAVYAKETEPLIGYYEQRGQLVRTKSDNSTLDENYARLQKALQQKA